METSILSENKFLNNEHFKQNLSNSDEKNIMKKHLIFWYETVNLPKNVPKTEKNIFESKNISRQNLTYREVMQVRAAA